MTPIATTFFFYLLSAATLVSGILMITRKNPVHSALAMIMTLLSLANLYLMLYAPFVAGVQVILYAGGIMVLFVFVIMLVNIEHSMHERKFNKQWHIGILASLLLGGLFVFVYVKGHNLFPEHYVALPEGTNTQDVGMLMFRNYLLPFEVASILLLVSMVGAVVMAKKRI